LIIYSYRVKAIRLTKQVTKEVQAGIENDNIQPKR
jgi:hypothetical protein